MSLLEEMRIKGVTPDLITCHPLLAPRSAQSRIVFENTVVLRFWEGQARVTCQIVTSMVAAFSGDMNVWPLFCFCGRFCNRSSYNQGRGGLHVQDSGLCRLLFAILVFGSHLVSKGHL